MEIRIDSHVISGRQIMRAAACITSLCSAYWLYKTVCAGQSALLPFGITAIVSAILIIASRKRR